MNEWLSNLWSQVRALPPQRQGVLAVTAVGSLYFFFWISQGMGAADYRLLYRGLAEDETARVAEALRVEKIPYQLDDRGTTILVPSQQVHEARIRMAGKGLPGGSSTGFELFDKPAFGVTDFVHRVNYVRAVQGELSRSIEQLDPVERARVQVVIPERSSVLAARQRKPSASVVVRLAPGRQLAPIQVNAIVHLVASGIESLATEDVTLVDGSGRLLAPQGDVSSGSLAPGGAPAHQLRVESELANRIESILEPVVGIGGVVARVSADMDWTESEVTEERFDPDSQVARSESRTDESEGAGGGDGGPAGILANSLTSGGGAATVGGSTRTTETFNYELSKTVSHRVTPMGTVKRLSVAVLVDSAGAGETTGEGGELVDPAWSPELLERFEQLAMQAVGYSEERGDEIVVSSASFRAPELEVEEGFVIDTELMIFLSQALRIGAQLLALVLFALFIVKPFLGVVATTASQTQLGLPAPVAALQAQLDGVGSVAPEAAALPKAQLTLAEQVSAEAGARTDDSVTTIRNWLNQS